MILINNLSFLCYEKFDLNINSTYYFYYSTMFKFRFLFPQIFPCLMKGSESRLFLSSSRTYGSSKSGNLEYPICSQLWHNENENNASH